MEEKKVTALGDKSSDLPKRFYKVASLEGGSCLLLDGKPARTRTRVELRAATRALGAAIVEEWNAQAEVIDFASMPMTRFQMTVLERGDREGDVWRAATLAFLRSDLVCYRAQSPVDLVRRQTAAWEPLLQWAAAEGIALKRACGVEFVEQPEDSLDVARSILAQAPAWEALMLKSAAEISGSAVIAFAMKGGAFDHEALFEASRVDETFQAEKWGWDPEAQARTQSLRRDFLDIARYSMLAAGAG